MRVLSIVIAVSLLLSGCTYNSNIKINRKENNISFLAEPIGVEDKSLNELSYRGILRSGSELDLKTKAIIVSSEDKYEETLREEAQNSYITIGIGSGIKEEIKKTAADMRSRNFVIIGDSIDLDNVQSITFKDEESAFLMGVLAGKYTKTNNVGYIGGKRKEFNQPIEAGFAFGINKVNAAASKGIINEENIKYTNDKNNEELGYEKAIELIKQGCDIIFIDSGKYCKGVLRAASENNIKVIGNEVNYINEYPEYSNVILGSVVKNIDTIIYEICSDAKKGYFKGGLQNKRDIDLESNLMNYAVNDNLEGSKEILQLLDKYKEEIILKNIKIPKRVINVKNI